MAWAVGDAHAVAVVPATHSGCVANYAFGGHGEDGHPILALPVVLVERMLVLAPGADGHAGHETVVALGLTVVRRERRREQAWSPAVRPDVGRPGGPEVPGRVLHPRGREVTLPPPVDGILGFTPSGGEGGELLRWVLLAGAPLL